MLFENTDVTIFSSREQIRNQLIEYCKKYMELESVDLYKTSFLSYMINVLSILSADQMFYTSSIYKEFFLLKAQLPESVNNLANWIGYRAPNATPATADVMITIPMGFQDTYVNFIIPENFTVYSGSIPFVIDRSFMLSGKVIGEDSVQSEITDMVQNKLTIRVINNKIVTVRDNNGFYYPITLNTDSAGRTASVSFILPFKQKQYSITTFQIPQDLEFYQFYTKKLSDITGQISDTRIYVFPSSSSSDVIIDASEKSKTWDNISDFNTYYNSLTESQKSELDSTCLWTQSTTGIHTLNQSDKQYVLTNFGDSIEILFGNGVIGSQPERGSIVALITGITYGEIGNVISGSITSGDSLFYESTSGKIQRIKYNIINNLAASGGKNTPTIKDIKKNSIAYLKSKSKLVSSDDYTSITSIINDIPLDNPTVVLKRSDIKANEINLFSQLVYNRTNDSGDPEIVPTRNCTVLFDSTSEDITYYIPKGHAADGDNSNFQTMFNLELDTQTLTAKYEYSITNTYVPCSLQSVTSDYNSLCYITIPTVKFNTSINNSNYDLTTLSVIANVTHTKSQDVTQFRCKMKTMYDESVYNMQTQLLTEDNLTVDKFSYTLSDFINIPKKDVSIEFIVEGYIPYDKITDDDKQSLGWGESQQISKPSAWLEISRYSVTTIIRQDLSDYMSSPIVEYDNGGMPSYLIHDVPCILTEYLQQDTFDESDFELNVIQKLISNLKINQYRMLTDFINVKFSDTSGKLTNMLYNPVQSRKVKSRTLTQIPSSAQINDTYIVNGSERDEYGNTWRDYVNYIAWWTGSSWFFSEPTYDQFVEIDNETDIDHGKKYIFTGEKWIEPIFDIPLEVSVRISQDPTVNISRSALAEKIRTYIVQEMSQYFGMDKNIDTSEILKIVRSIDGVKNAKILKPEVDIQFKYNLSELTQEQLLKYTPQLVAITYDSISVTIV